MPIRWLCLIALWLSAAGVHAATRIDLTRDWSFRVESGVDGVKAGWPAAIPEGVTAVELPHTWNRTGPDYEYLGVGWYFRRLDLPKLPAVDAENRAFASGARPVDTQAFTLEQAMPSRKPGPVRLVVKLLRPESTVAMERTLAAP
jgi:hypothetical protein